jgi:phosphotransacetylase
MLIGTGRPMQILTASETVPAIISMTAVAAGDAHDM